MPDRTRRVLVQKMENLQRAGVRRLRTPRNQGHDEEYESGNQPDRQPDKEPDRQPDKEHGLRRLAQEVVGCTQCAELAARRTQTVFGVGNPQARLCFFGEAPGADEDRQGEPFVGRAGQLLNDIIKACTLTREEVYILNVLKCRPPNNRTPTNEEIGHCRHFFQRQLEIIRPEFICCLGAVAATTLLETNEALGRLRGRLHTWRETQVLVTYHPAYLLRNPAKKRDTWDDMKLLMRAMGITLPSRGARRS